MIGVCFGYLDSYGHLYPVLTTVQELIKRGHEIVFYSDEKFRSIITSVGAQFRAYPSLEESSSIDSCAHKGFFKRWYSSFAASVAVTVYLRDRLRAELLELRPEFCLYDSASSWGRQLAVELDIPRICYCTSYAFTEELLEQYQELIDTGYFGMSEMSISERDRNKALLNKALYKLSARYGTAEQNMYDFLRRPEKQILMYSYRELQLCANATDNIYEYVGGDLFEQRKQNVAPELAKLIHNQQCIYISLGSEHFDNLSFFNKCAEAAQQLPYPIVIAVGSEENVEKIVVPSGAEIYIGAMLPQLEVLKHAALFITHAGTNSVVEAIQYCVPMIAIPQDIDQFIIAEAIELKKLGKRILEADFMEANLTEVCMQVLGNKEIRTNIEHLSNKMQLLSGRNKAADLIEEQILKQRQEYE